MQQPKTSAQLKQIARGIMLGKYRAAILVLLATELIVTTLTLVTNYATGTTVTGIIFGFVLSFIITLLSSVLYVGQNAFYLNIACNQPYQLSDLFTGFKIQPNKTIIIQCILQLACAVPFIPALIALFGWVFTENPVNFLIFSLLLIIGGFVSCWILLAYSQCYYLLLDFPDCDTLELMKMSRRLMKGNMFRMLYLQVSFIPFIMIGLVSFGVGLLFVSPYQNMTCTLFYLDLIQCRNANQQLS